ncbi:DUF4352 domain-containing protein, partial [Oenococcus oeni]|uniref:DUF4352 domain-containing protein n=2 Tax=Oenococcus oeni TaxID=1247 RepID=UPI000A74FB2E
VGSFSKLVTIPASKKKIAYYVDSNRESKKNSDTTIVSVTVKAQNSSNQTYSVGDTAKVGNIDLKVNSVSYLQPTDMDDLSSGQEFVAVNFTLNNVGENPEDYNEFYFALSDNGNDTDMDQDPLDENANERVSNTLSSGSLESSASLTVNLVGAANPNDTLQFVYKGNGLVNKNIRFNLK